MKRIIFIFSILLIINCNTNIDPLEITTSPLPNTNDSTIAFVADDIQMGFHVAVHYNPSLTINLSSGTFDLDPCWTPEKKNIFYTSIDRENEISRIWKMKYDGSDKRCITPQNISCYCPQISPDGESLVFMAEIDNLHQIIITDTMGNNWRQITNPKMIPGISEAIFYLPSWAPDGVSIIFNYADNTIDGYSTRHLAMLNIISKEIICLSKIDTMYPHHAKISPKFNELIFVGKGIPGDQIYRINIDQTNLVKLSDAFIAGFPDWSSDGERIIFVQKLNCIEEPDAIWVMNRDGSEKRKLISREGYLCSMPDW